jgi:hypothetical protein
LPFAIVDSDHEDVGVELISMFHHFDVETIEVVFFIILDLGLNVRVGGFKRDVFIWILVSVIDEFVVQACNYGGKLSFLFILFHVLLFDHKCFPSERVIQKFISNFFH